jgi:hypothetical protein
LWRLARPRQRGWLIAAVVAIVLSSTVLLLWQGPLRGVVPLRSAPAWLSGPIACPPNPMEHVSVPTRLDVVARCSTLSGTVRSVDRDPHDLELVILVEPDAEYADFIDSRIQRYVIVKVPPVEQPGVTVPVVDEHATFYGSWAVNRRASVKGTLELHPTWAITTEHAASDASAVPVFDVTVTSPRSVAVGAPLRLSVSVKSRAHEPPEAVSEAVVYLELRGPDGVSRWAAELSNGFGVATVSLASLEIPGEYTVWAHASKGNDFGTASASVRIHRS